jgi:hypothetical protein
MAEKTRVNADFSTEQYRMLADLSQESGEPMTQVLRDAVKVLRLVRRHTREGARLLVERDGEMRELVLL